LTLDFGDKLAVPATVATDIESLFGGHAHQRAPGDRNHAFRQSSRRTLIYMPRWNLHFDLGTRPLIAITINQGGRLFVV
jgi:hypothetical protein